MGNQDVYNAWGNLSMTVAGLCVPVGKAVNGVAGMGTGVMAQTAAKTVVKESIKDAAYDRVSETITDYATDKLGLNQTWSTVLNLGLSIGIEQGAEAIGGKLGHGATLAEEMSLDEAKRYNEYWDSLEKGTHNPHPGLSEADIAAWNLADAQVNEHILVEKIDTNALIDLHSQELALQNSFQNGTVMVDGSVDGIGGVIESGTGALEGILDDVPQGGIEGTIPIRGYSNFADGMSPEDAARYIANNEKAFFNEFSERASAAGLNNVQIAEAFESMRTGDYAKMATYFDTSSPVDGAVFWSGNKEGAATYATNIGGTIMEQTSGGQVFDSWRGLEGMYPATEWGTGSSLDQKPIWNALSAQYAEGAVGDVTYVHIIKRWKALLWNSLE